MSGAIRGHRVKMILPQIREFRGEERTLEERSSNGSQSATPFKLSTPALIGIATVGVILIGLAVLFWRWQARRREIARMDRQFKGSYEKYGIGRGIESNTSSSSSGSKSSSPGGKLDPYGSFFEVETEKPKKALLHFRRSLQSNASNSGFSSVAPQSAWGPGRVTQKQWGGSPPLSAPPGLGGATARSPRSSFSFSLKKDRAAEVKVQHLPSSLIKSKGISAPLIVANGGPEPWSPSPSGTSFHGFGALAAPPPPSQQPQQPDSLSPPPPAAFPQKFKQPQPRSSPATPGTSQKPLHTTHNLSDFLSVPEQPQQRVSANTGLHSSDGSLYSRNSFSSSNHDDLHQAGLLAMSPAGEGDSDHVPKVKAAAFNLPSTSSVNPLKKQGKGQASQQQQQQQQPQQVSSTSSLLSYYAHDAPGEIPRPASPTPYFDPYSPTSPSSAQQHRDHLPRLMTVIAPFMPTLEDELPLKVGDTVRVIEEYRDGWCLVQEVGRIDSPRGVVPCVCLQERKRIVPVPVNVGVPRNKASLVNLNQWR